MGIIIALLIFSLIILFHELGHFLLAKKNGITVTEFSLGMGPRLLKVTKGGTMYSLKALPFGGSCQMVGDDEDSEDPGAFANKSVWARLSVIVAGPIFNFILAFFFGMIIVMNVGSDPAVLKDVPKDYPAYEAGVRAGDEILKMNGSRVHLYREVTAFNLFHQGETLNLEYKSDGKVKKTTIEPKKDQDGAYRYGFTGNANRVKGGPVYMLKSSVYEVRYWIKYTFQSLGMLVKGQVKLDDMAGPVGIVDMIGSTYEQSKTDGPLMTLLSLLNITVLISANVGVMNLLPLPALDGGRIVFLIVEIFRKKRINQEKEAMIHFAGLVLLMILMVVIMVNDFRRIF